MQQLLHAWKPSEIVQRAPFVCLPVHCAPDKESTHMPLRRPDARRVHLSLVNVLREHGMQHLAGMVQCRFVPALAFPTYLVIAAGEARAFVAAALERALGREFATSDAPWVLETEEATRLAYSPAI
jgi:hypothetical protein